MKTTWIAIIMFCAIGVLIFGALNLKGEPQMIQARYLMFSCERCYHMEVEKPERSGLAGSVIIPKSSDLDIEQMIERALTENRNQFCLKGRWRMFNLDFLSIDPKGTVFFVEESFSLEHCRNI